MGWKLLFLTAIVAILLRVLGYGPSNLKQAAWDVSYANAEAISVGGSDAGGWGQTG